MEKTFIIAEMSANHGHDINRAKETMLAMKAAGADAVKIQSYTPDTITLNCDKPWFQITQGTLWDGQTLYELYQKAYTPFEWHEDLFAFAKAHDILLFSTPFDYSAVDLLERCHTPLYKIASFEIMDIPLIKYIAKQQKPMIMSVGIASLDEIKEAVEACRSMGNNDITLLQCTSEYPAKIEDANLLMMQDIAKRFKVKVGLSDHTLGHLVATLAVAMGATVVEKHVTLNREVESADSAFSLTIEEFKVFVAAIRQVEVIKGRVDYSLTDRKVKNRAHGRSLFCVKDIKKGDNFTAENIRSIRPGNGLAPKYYPEILGKKALCDIEYGTPLEAAMIQGGVK